MKRRLSGIATRLDAQVPERLPNVTYLCGMRSGSHAP